MIVSLKLLLACTFAPPMIATGVIASQVTQEDQQERWEQAGKPSAGRYD